MSFYRKNDVLALDFDGVISDSIGECLVVGNNAFSSVSGRDEMIGALDELPSVRVEEAKRLRNFIRSGEDYVYIFLALTEGEPIGSQKEFDDFTSRNASKRRLYYQAFYDLRSAALQADPDQWASLSPLYPGVRNFLFHYSPKSRLFIVSTKKPAYIGQILSFNQIELSDEQIFHSDKDHSKRHILEALACRLEVSPARITFVDDQIDTLIKVKPSGVKCLLAEWGYNNSDQIRQAKESGIQTLTLERFLTEGLRKV